MAERVNKQIIKDIKKIIEEDIEPMLNRDGGGLEFISYEDGVVKVKLQGACHGCPRAQFTLKGMVEAILVDSIPEVISVENINE